MRLITILYLCKDYNKCHCHTCDPCKHTSDVHRAANWDHVPDAGEREAFFRKQVYDDRSQEIWIEKEELKDEET